ncbi:MAG: sensor domain-containing diguanylate cyclase [Clostridiaceae bacterium]|mgnify:CR=1 FL=1|jgi:diguanylate cyclase (GGDEF)-like protein|nr:sensor domain-containing diguanylate cyclase [Clostridiaceae bacterium]
MWKNKRIKIVFLSAFLAMIISTFYMLNIITNEVAIYKLEATSVLDNQVASIKNEFTVNINSVYELRALIFGAGGEYIDPQIIGERILKNPNIRNILYAPDSVVTNVYPLETNECIVGLNLLSPENQSFEDAMLAVQSEDVILTGPYDLNQGGKAFSARLAVRIPDNQSSELKYSGLVSVTMNFPDVISKSTDHLSHGLKYNFVLEKKLPDSEDFVEIYSGRHTESDDFIFSDFSISNINFRLSIVPQDGWHNKSGIILRIFAFIAVSLAVGIIMGFIFTARQNLIEKSRTDALTGIYNRAGGTYAITSIIKSHLYKNGAFVMMDLDNFKSVNDVLGHQMGDEVLVTTAAILKNSLRDTDIVARLGGDEFMLYLPFEGSADFLEKKLEDIRIKMNRDIKGADGIITISSSIGATFYSKGKNFDSLYKEADQALYKSKENGKNQITIFR